MKRLAIVDLDNTLVAAQDDCVYTVDDIEFDNLIIRPFAPEFINWLYKYFDIILFTTGSEKYINTCMETYFIPFQTKISHVLHSGHANLSQKKYGLPKHSEYIKSICQGYHTIIGIDDQSQENMDPDGYSKIYAVEPFLGKHDFELKRVRKLIDKDFQLSKDE